MLHAVPPPPKRAVSSPRPRTFQVAADESAAISPLWRVKGYRGKAFVDQQNDVAASDIALAEREGFRAVEHLKRYTTLGMATDQGRTANVNALAIMAELTGKSIPETGMTVARPPYTPVALGALAGHHRGKSFKPTRLPPSYAWAKEQGAVFVETGLWLRPSYFPRPGETRLARDGDARGQHGAQRRRHLRRLDARQGRRAGPRRRSVPRPHLHERHEDPRRRQGALRRHAARGRHPDGRRHRRAARREPLLHHHDDGERRQGLPAHGVLPPVAVAGAGRADDLGDRAVGAVCGRGPEIARAAAQRSSIRRSTFRMRASRIFRSARSRSAAASRRASSACRSRASAPTRSACRRASATR